VRRVSTRPTGLALSRRGLLRGGTAATITGLVGAKSLAAATPSASEGPFYPRPSMRFPDEDSDLVKIQGAVEAAGGEPIQLTGRVLDSRGQPVPGAKVEIWQCDVNGRYLHTGDRGGPPRDAAFQGFGRAISDAGGHYRFRTIMPVPYPGRTPHIHAKVFHDGRVLTTQFYLADHPLNARDWLFNRMSEAQQQSVLMTFDRSGAEPETQLDILL